MRKPKILWVGEATFLNTGYAVYGKEVLSRLHKTGKYEIAELACYGEIDNPQRYDVPWKYYSNLPPTNPSDPNFSHEEMNTYNTQQTYQFGEWRFDEVCLDFQPDIVIDIRDWWMFEHIGRSAFREYFKWIIMPTVDSAPQQEQYLDTFIDADYVFTYSEYGKRVLLEESAGRVNFCGVAPPGVSFDMFKPVPNKTAHKSVYGFSDNIKIVGTVMRNQGRKLYPDLFKGFSLFCKQNPELALKTFLYCHLSYPDNGWDIPKYLRMSREYGIAHKVLFTYICHNCRFVFPSFFQDARCYCPKCNQPTAQLPNTKDGVTSDKLVEIYNWMDLYVTYSVCEGFGMPQVEAAACGVPIMSVNYSAMESVLDNLNGIGVNPVTMFVDVGTDSERAYPDNQDFANKLASFLKKPEPVRMKMGREAMLLTREHYSFDKTAKQYEELIDSIPLIPLEQSWASKKSRVHIPNLSPPQNLTTEQFVTWAIMNTLGRRDKCNSYLALRTLRDLNYGKSVSGAGGMYENEACYMSFQNRYNDFGWRDALQKFANMTERRNFFENRRLGLIREPQPYFIQRAKP